MGLGRTVSSAGQGRAPIRPLPLLFVLLGAPVAWSLHLLLSYFLVTLACAGVLMAPMAWLIGASVVSGVVAAAAGIAAFRSSSRLRASHQSGDARAGGVALFMARTGLVLSAIFLLGILLAGVPPLVLGPCG